MSVSDSFLTDMRDRIRINHNRSDSELRDLIEAARAELVLAGVTPRKASDEADPLVKAAIAVYIKAEFGLDAPDTEKYRESFERQRVKMALSDDYSSDAERG